MEIPDQLILRNSVVHLEKGAAGIIARIERLNGIEYGGPLPPETVDALREVATA